MKLSWPIWLIVTVLWFFYLGAGYLASRVEAVVVILRPGFSADLSFFRLIGDQPAMSLEFKRQAGQMRPELGDSMVKREGARPGYVEYSQPGPPIRILVSSSGTEPVAYEAMPPASFSADNIGRPLTSSLSIAPGTWRSSRQDDGPTLHWGINRLGIEVAVVGPQLSNEKVQLVVAPSLSLKSCHPKVCWLGWGLLLAPIVLAVQLIWLAVLGFLALRKAG